MDSSAVLIQGGTHAGTTFACVSLGVPTATPAVSASSVRTSPGRDSGPFFESGVCSPEHTAGGASAEALYSTAPVEIERRLRDARRLAAVLLAEAVLMRSRRRLAP